MRFRKKGKLSPRIVGPFEVLRRIGKLAYELALTPNMQQVHSVFHVSMLRKCNSDARKIGAYERIDMQLDVTYMEQPGKVIDRKGTSAQEKGYQTRQSLVVEPQCGKIYLRLRKCNAKRASLFIFYLIPGRNPFEEGRL